MKVTGRRKEAPALELKRRGGCGAPQEAAEVHDGRLSRPPRRLGAGIGC